MFITLEGTEGVGKTTLIAKLKAHFEAAGRTVVLSREPGGTPLAEKIRSLLIGHTDEVFHGDTELLLFFAGRKQNITINILPALANGHILINDRFFDSSYAYQSAGRGLSIEKFDLLVEHFVDVKPDITLWLDAPVEIGMSRAQKRAELDRFEKEKADFFNKVRQGFAELHQKYPERIVRIDASQDEDAVFKAAIEALTEKAALLGKAV